MTVRAQYVAFTVAGARYAIGIGALVEVVNMVALTPLPDRPVRAGERNPVAGLVNVRGRVIPVLSLRTLLSLEETPPTSQTRILLLQSPTGPIGLVVDSVQGVIDPEPEKVAHVETRAKGRGTEVLSAIYQDEQGMILILDDQRLLAHADIVGIGTDAPAAAGDRS